jgi:NADH-quinone oxidoreductase subunit C
MPVVEKLTADAALERVQAALGSKVTDPKVNHGAVDVTCSTENLVDVVTTLRDAEGIRCRFFSFLSGIDRSEFADDPGGLEVLIHLHSPEHAFSVAVHVPVELGDAHCPSITSVFLGALWHERECFEMFGVEFEGHPRLVGIYLHEDFEGRPGLRSFKLPSRTAVKAWPGAKDPEEAAAGGR